MAEVTSYTKPHLDTIIAELIVDAHLDGDDLILVKNDETEINVGSVRGLTGLTGPEDTRYTVCTSATRPGSPNDGDHIYETNTQLVYYWDDTAEEWKLVTAGIPHMEMAQEPVSTSGMTSATFANFAVTVAKDITKLRDDTKLIVNYQGSIWNDDPLGEYEVAVRIDGVDHILVNGFHNVGPKAGMTEILSLDAGTYTCVLKRRRPNGTGTVFDGQSSDSWNSFWVIETF